ncbi:tRNA-5-taurinomethyluridine 2-sulfurtransferase [Saccharomycopsis crataegensis]|uniref:tRNA-5-taurinomethyluridine 2-sulfurtransferase n=1 Tax=Saccharomycopsis crataegensis TaxID=43959 RepID=A0AAV5QVK5_9ASCO|nr:tRNA-5-taurinomethyluridine 2-sulfurtransferase [Saccharomycopsis crataegensis]
MFTRRILSGASRRVSRCYHPLRYSPERFASSFLNQKTPSLGPAYVQSIPSADDEIIVAMSSGVDSSVCAALFASEYKNVRGIYMANWSQTKECVERDWKDVKSVCKKIGIPCERVNFEKEYWIDVFEPMINQYRRGLTPNPDVSCNRYIKFGSMIEHLAKRFGSTSRPWWLVTGHYARIMRHEPTGKHHLLRGSYDPKDQSYYLSTVSAPVLERVLLPLGHMTKPEVRRLAKEVYDLPTSEKPDSQGLCFVSQKGSFRDFLGQYIEPNPGNVITQDGRVSGKHEGLWHATIGQRAGVEMPQGDEKYKGVWFVSEKRIDTNELVIVKGSTNEELYTDTMSVEDWYWLDPSIDCDNIFKTHEKITAQHRSLQDEVEVSEVLKTNKGIKVKFKTKSRAIAPGQSLVLYGDHNRLLGSGIIMKSWRDEGLEK